MQHDEIKLAKKIKTNIKNLWKTWVFLLLKNNIRIIRNNNLQNDNIYNRINKAIIKNKVGVE